MVAVGVHPHGAVADPVADPQVENALVPVRDPWHVGSQVVDVLEAARVVARQLLGEAGDRWLSVLRQDALDEDDEVAVGVG